MAWAEGDKYWGDGDGSQRCHHACTGLAISKYKPYKESVFRPVLPFLGYASLWLSGLPLPGGFGAQRKGIEYVLDWCCRLLSGVSTDLLWCIYFLNPQSLTFSFLFTSFEVKIVYLTALV